MRHFIFQVYNADETGLFWRHIPESTLAGSKENNPPGHKKNKERITVLTCANAMGTHRLPLLVIGKSKSPRALKGVQLQVEYNSSGKAWMTHGLFSNWFHSSFVPKVKEHYKSIGLSKESKCILLLDNATSHLPMESLCSGNIWCVSLPPNVTCLVQPMDQGVIANLKSIYSKHFLRNILKQDGTVEDLKRHYNLKHCLDNLSAAWLAINCKTLSRAWYKLWPSLRIQLHDEVSDDDDDFVL